MSLAGFIAAPNDAPGNPGGDDFMRLQEWYGFNEDFSVGSTKWGAHFISEINATGAVLAGRRTAEQGDHWGGNHHGVPIFVPSNRPPGPSVANYPLVTYAGDGIVSAMAQAKAAAKAKNVMVHGGYTAQRALEAGCWTNCRFIKSRCCSEPAADSSRHCRRASSWRSSE
jgi:dihydrofolate reductase